MMRRLALVAAAAIIFATAATAPAETPAPEQPTVRTRIGKKVYRPHKHITLVRKFTPTATPSPSYVKTVILPHEAARWNVSLGWLMGRVSCETGGLFNYWADNASSDAAGLVQFMPETWGRALQRWDRRVAMRRETTQLVHKKVVLLYSDGSRNVVKGRLVRRRVSIVRRGLLPRWPSVYHGWANARAATRAMAGIGNVRSSEWSCA